MRIILIMYQVTILCTNLFAQQHAISQTGERQNSLFDEESECYHKNDVLRTNVKLAVRYFQLNQREKANALLDSAMKTDSSYCEIWIAKAYIAFSDKRYSDALDIEQKLVNENPTSRRRFELASLHGVLHQYSKAISILEQLAEERYRLSVTYLLLAESNFSLDKWDRSKMYALKTIDIYTNSKARFGYGTAYAKAHTLLGIIALSEGNKPLAKRHFIKCEATGIPVPTVYKEKVGIK